MRRRYGQPGMSLLEVLVALAVILILISSLIGVGSYVKTRAEIDLTGSMLEVLTTALTQYYDDFGDFPFITEKDYTGDGAVDPYDKFHLEYDLQGTISSGILPVHTGVKPVDPTPISSASSAALFYFLDKNPSSRAIASAVANSLVTNKDANGQDITIEQPTGSGNIIDLPRYIDPWKMSIRYDYLTGTAFPVLTSAGPDKSFDTQDDITSK